MPTYNYTARDEHGKKVKAQIGAQDKISAINEIKRLNLIPLKIEELSTQNSKTSGSYNAKGLYKYKMKKKKLSFILNQFSVMLKSGVPLPLVFEVLIEQESDKKVRDILISVNEDILSGSPLSAAMGRFRAFPSVITNMVAAGEANGRLELSFERASVNLEKELELNGKIKSAMAYPAFLLVIVLIITMVLNIVILPAFVKMFKSMDTTLPIFTIIVLNVSSFIKNFWHLMIVAVFLLTVLYKVLRKKSDAFKKKTDYFKLRIPVFGKLFKQTLTARFCRVFESLIDAGVEVVRSLEIAGEITANRYMQSEIESVIKNVKLGIPINNAMSMHNIFPPLLVSMIRVGEESGSLGEVLGKMADIYEAETATTTKRLTAIMEPVMTIIIAVVVGTVVLAIMLPMFSIYNKVGSYGSI